MDKKQTEALEGNESPAHAAHTELEDAARALVEAIEYTPLGLRSIKALEKVRAALPSSAQVAPVDADVRLERERLCAAIKAEDDYCVEHGDYMLDSDDCIKIVRGEWQRPDFAIAALAAQKETND